MYIAQNIRFIIAFISVAYAASTTINDTTTGTNPSCLASQANAPPLNNHTSCGYKMIEKCLKTFTVPDSNTFCSDVAALNSMEAVDQLIVLNPGIDCDDVLYQGEQLCVLAPDSPTISNCHDAITCKDTFMIPNDCTERIIVKEKNQTCSTIASTYLNNNNTEEKNNKNNNDDNQELEYLNPGLICSVRNLYPGEILCIKRCNLAPTFTTDNSSTPPESSQTSIITSNQIRIPLDCQERYITQPFDSCHSISTQYLNSSDLSVLTSMNGGLDCANFREKQLLCIARCNYATTTPTPTIVGPSDTGALAPFNYATTTSFALPSPTKPPCKHSKHRE